MPRRAWTEEADDGGFLSRTMPRVVHGSPQSHGSSTLERSPPMQRGGESRITLGGLLIPIFRVFFIFKMFTFWQRK